MTNSQTPILSIGMPVFNGERFLREALDSLLLQEGVDFEIIISDNASTDGTAEICREYASRDSRIRYLRNESNMGAARNYNRLVELARGQFFKWAAHDDVCCPGMLSRCLAGIQRAPESVVLIYPRTVLIDEHGATIAPSPDRAQSSSKYPWRRLAQHLKTVQTAHPLWGVIRLDALRQTRLMGCLLSDFVLLAELALIGNIYEVPEVLFKLRIHSGNAAKALVNPRDLLIWHDPTKRGDGLWIPEWMRLKREYLQAVRHVMRSKRQRWLCYAAVLGTPVWRALLRWSGPARQWARLDKQHLLGHGIGQPAADAPYETPGSGVRKVSKSSLAASHRAMRDPLRRNSD